MTAVMPGQEAGAGGRPSLTQEGKPVTFLEALREGIWEEMERDPDVFRDVWGGRWVGVRLDGIDADELRQLVTDAYCLVAPKRLAKAFDPQ